MKKYQVTHNIWLIQYDSYDSDDIKEELTRQQTDILESRNSGRGSRNSKGPKGAESDDNSASTEDQKEDSKEKDINVRLDLD